jgi:glycosyltransferase involved in cell wall biosynthesis
MREGPRNTTTRVCAISFKECWQDGTGRWCTNGGFPLQMGGIASLFDRMTLLVTFGEKPGGGSIPLPENADIVIIRHPVGSGVWRKLWIAAHLPYYIRVMARYCGEADVVHVPPPGDIPLVGMIVALAMRKKTIIRYCGSWTVTRQTTLTNRFTRGVIRLFAGGRNVMLATGEGEKPPGRGISWIFSTALSARELRSTTPVYDRAPGSPPRLVYIGRLHKIKGVENLISALDLLSRGGFTPLPSVTIIGEGPDREMLERMAVRDGLRDRVRFAGQLDRSALVAALRDLDLCVQPSLSEGFSKAWLDAFSMGLPVLASNVGAARGVIGPDGTRGWLVPPGDVSALADKLRYILTADLDWAPLRRRCRQFVEGRTLESWAETIGKMCAGQWGWNLTEGKLREPSN